MLNIRTELWARLCILGAFIFKKSKFFSEATQITGLAFLKITFPHAARTGTSILVI